MDKNFLDKPALTEESFFYKTGKFAYLVSSGFISEKNLKSILLRESTEGVEIEKNNDSEQKNRLFLHKGECIYIPKNTFHVFFI